MASWFIHPGLFICFEMESSSFISCWGIPATPLFQHRKGPAFVLQFSCACMQGMYLCHCIRRLTWIHIRGVICLYNMFVGFLVLCWTFYIPAYIRVFTQGFVLGSCYLRSRESAKPWARWSRWPLFQVLTPRKSWIQPLVRLDQHI